MRQSDRSFRSLIYRSVPGTTDQRFETFRAYHSDQAKMSNNYDPVVLDTDSGSPKTLDADDHNDGDGKIHYDELPQVTTDDGGETTTTTTTTDAAVDTTTAKDDTVFVDNSTDKTNNDNDGNNNDDTATTNSSTIDPNVATEVTVSCESDSQKLKHNSRIKDNDGAAAAASGGDGNGHCGRGNIYKKPAPCPPTPCIVTQQPIFDASVDDAPRRTTRVDTRSKSDWPQGDSNSPERDSDYDEEGSEYYIAYRACFWPCDGKCLRIPCTRCCYRKCLCRWHYPYREKPVTTCRRQRPRHRRRSRRSSSGSGSDAEELANRAFFGWFCCNSAGGESRSSNRHGDYSDTESLSFGGDGCLSCDCLCCLCSNCDVCDGCGDCGDCDCGDCDVGDD